MNTTTITVNGAIGDEVWYLETLKASITLKNYKGAISYTTYIITDYEIMSTKIHDIQVLSVRNNTVRYELGLSNGNHIVGIGKIYQSKSGARRARKRLIELARAKGSKLIWG